MADEFDDAAWELTKRLALTCDEQDWAVVMKGCCWLLATLILERSRQGDTTLDIGLRTCTDLLIHCTAQLASQGQHMPLRVQ